MQFRELDISGAYLIEVKPHPDDRGFFARTFCQDEMVARGLDPTVAQCNVSFNERAGTVRGMHYSVAPSAEEKLVRCTRGAIHDVLLDLRPTSPTYLQHVGVRLDAEQRNALWVPLGIAHGFQTLEPETEVFYQMSTVYDAGCARGVRFDDPAFAIGWPLEISKISDRDRTYPDWNP